MPNASCTDCAGILNGSAVIDQCGVCAGGTTGIVANASCSDCANVPNGTAVVDDCGDCVLGTTGRFFNAGCNIDCNGDINGTAAIDTCGVCAGGNTGIVPNSSCGGSACVPVEVVGLMLIDASTSTDVGFMADGDTIDLSMMPDFSVRAEVCSEPDVESVVFNLDGNDIRTENVMPYSVNGDNNGSFDPWPLPVGTYTLTATPYDGNNASGTAGVVESVTFHVVYGPPVADCNGVLGGTAYLDACGNCVGGNTGNTPCTPPAGCGEFIEINGLVVVEVESEPFTNTNWYQGNGPVNGLNVPTPSGTYYMWKANCVSGTDPNYSYSACGGTNSGSAGGPITYQINISTPGRYRFQMRSWQPALKLSNHGAGTENNDFWLQLPDGGGIKKKGGNEISIGTSEWVKIYQNNTNSWVWASNTVDNNPHQVYVDFPAPGTYTVKIAGRSKLLAIDRFVLYRSDNPANNVDQSVATSMSQPESPRGSCGGARTAGTTQDQQGNNQRTGQEDQTAPGASLGHMDQPVEDQFQVTAYPNPTGGLLNLGIIPADGEALIELYDATGKLLLQKQQTGEQNQIDMSAYANGLYWLKVHHDKQLSVTRIYKE
jgi:hypothetical protein